MRLLNFLDLSRHGYSVWGAVDALCILAYCAYNVVKNRFPYIYDYEELQDYWRHQYSVADWQFWIVPMIAMLWFLHLSMVVSCVIFFLRQRVVRYVVLAQVPLRLVALAASVLIIYGIKTTFDKIGFGFLLVIFITIEILRLRSVFKPQISRAAVSHVGTQ